MTTVARSILYVFAHQDDEILILPKLLDEVRRGDRVQALWITDGAKGGNPPKREAESREAMRRVGLPQDRLHFLQFPDTRSVQHLRKIDEQATQIAVQDPPAEIVSPAFEGGHMDHDVAAFIAARLTNRQQPRPLHHEYPLYNRLHGKRQIGQFLPTSNSQIHTLPPTDEIKSFMQQIAKIYRTQRLGLWLLALGGQKQKLLNRGVIWREAPSYDFLTRPMDEPLEYEKSWFHHGKWQDWTATVTTFESERKL